MPVITRSKSKRCLSSIPKDVKLYLPKVSSSDDPPQNLVVYPKCRQSQSKQQSRQQSRKQSHKYQDSSQEKPPGGSTNIHLPNLSSTTITHWPCRACDCPQGVFELFVPICVNCGHDMDNHELPDSDAFNPLCDYICEREELVSSVLQQAIIMGMVVIRATPVVGKTTLLKLLGRHILFHKRELEPIFITWQPKHERNNLPYQQFLDEKAVSVQEANAKHRPHNPKAKRIFLIDEAQGSYEDEDFWTHDLKNHLTRSRPIFVLACLYSPVGIFGSQGQRVESRASKVDTLNRIELRPSKSNSLGMLFKPEETLTKVSKWIHQNDLKPESVDRIAIAEIAYRRLIPGPPPGTNSDQITLQQACLNAIERFSPSVLHHRVPSSNSSFQSIDSWGIPEAAFQDEMYCCLNYELHNLPILSEYAETKDGRIDFYIFDKRWGIEILQSGNNGRLEEHANRFRYGGKYYKWGIFEEYIILNFCSKSSIDTLQVKDIDILKHILHIVIDANECTAEVYTYNKQLQATLDLGEGRQRWHSAEQSSTSEDFDVYMTLRDQKIEMEQTKKEKQEMRQEIIQLKLQLNQR
ncbi:predicted protein [Sclerotinia sclerotiorum 1980 UF-70]|uniref:Uncharacterized protein n=1 Tax=Sclerotinia sclerotiorum (strain ATCC 18683 / 1980 / Ss-1) TaxID=665079 RepID=A7E5N9_SCLS1|nr:predicted protein [Sclerotinia sclerotiorum 1980 UF-70]EDN91211.1 predicted protein [Sclerotinia sclerotiorum 1980 UF-70]